MSERKLRLCVEIPQGVGSTVRDATDKEVLKAATIKRRLQLLREQRDALDKQIEMVEEKCNHQVIFDQEGWPYDSRECYACGKGMGLI